MRKPGRGQILENRLVGPREVLGGGDRRVPAKGRGRTAPCRGRSGASWIWATPLTPARARGSSVRATPSLRPPRILKTSLFLQKGGPRKEPSQRTATALFYLIPCGDFQLSPREFYLSLITRIQLLTIEDLLGGKSIDYPQAADVTFKKAQRVRSNPSEQKTLPMEGDPSEKKGSS